MFATMLSEIYCKLIIQVDELRKDNKWDYGSVIQQMQNWTVFKKRYYQVCPWYILVFAIALLQPQHALLCKDLIKAT